MSEYLSKEEIKQWRSSLEKITLEEYAARLGKKLEQDKPTNDLVDIVLKGQPVIFKVTVHEVKERVFPEFDKDFFEDLNVGGVESLEDLKRYIKENKEVEKEKQIEDEYLFKCLDKVVEDSKFEIPAEMTEDEVNRLVREFSEKLQYQGLRLEDYLKYCNTSMDDFKATLKDEANKRIGYRLMMDAIVQKEGLEVTDEELEKAVVPIIPLGKLIQPEDIAETILFLSGKQAKMITGQVIKVSGGHAL